MVTPQPPQAEGPGAGGRGIALHGILSGLSAHEITLLTLANWDDPYHHRAIDALRQQSLDTHVVWRRRPSGWRLWKQRASLAAAWIRTGAPWMTVLSWRREMQARLDEILGTGQFDLILVEDQELGRYRFNTSSPLVLTEHEVRYPRRWDRSILRLPLDPGRILRELDWHRWLPYQKAVWQRFDRIQAFTERDAKTIERLVPQVKDRVRVNPLGTMLPPISSIPAEGDRLLFVGSFGHWPNVDAALWLAQEIMPRIRALYPTAHLDIVGSGPPLEVRELGSDAIDVIGEVPKVEPYLARASVVLAPIRVGGGMRVKVLQALAARKPVVTTSRGAEGLEVEGEMPPLLIADRPDDFARAAVTLLESAALRDELGRRAYRYVCEHFSPEAHARRMEALYEDLLSWDEGGGEALDARPTSMLELAHPRGMASTVLVLGGGCPPAFLPELRPARVDRADLVFICPNDDEHRTQGWLERAVRVASRSVGADGVVFASVPARSRSIIGRYFRRYGLHVETAFLHLPGYGMTGCFVPMDRTSLRYVIANVLPIARWKREVALTALRLPGTGRALSYVLPSVTLAARQRQSQPLFRWLLAPEDGKDPGDRVVMTRSWRGEDGPVGPVALHCFHQGAATPSWVAKIDVARLHYDQGRDVRVEAEALQRLGPSAQQAGARVPLPASLRRIGNAELLVQAGVSGQPVEPRLASHPECLPDVLQPLVHWLGAWSRLTSLPTRGSEGLFDEHVLGPAAQLAPHLEGGTTYLNWLTERCDALRGAAIPLVATHNDLNMKNVFLDTSDGLSIIDWVTGRERFLPLVDFYYAVFDAVVVTQGYREHLLAYQRCFSPSGDHRGLVERFERELREILHIDDDVRDLCFHACWLHHAANQLRFSGENGHFVQIVQSLALQHVGGREGGSL